MAPEVGLSRGYSFPADVYSFGMLIWQICSMERPFSHIKSSREFDRVVYMQNERPVIRTCWPAPLKELMSRCWSASPSIRPMMVEVKSALSSVTTTVACERKPARRTFRSRLTRSSRVNTTIWLWTAAIIWIWLSSLWEFIALRSIMYGVCWVLSF